MQQINGKWGAYDTSGTGLHRCFEKKELRKSVTQKEEEDKQPQLKNLLEMTLLVQQLDERLKRVEGIVIDPTPKDRSN